MNEQKGAGMRRWLTCQAEDSEWLCTLEFAHDGDHIAHTDAACTIEAHRWPRGVEDDEDDEDDGEERAP